MESQRVRVAWRWEFVGTLRLSSRDHLLSFMSIARKFWSLSRKWTHSFPDVVCNLAGSTGHFRVDLWGGRWVICVIKSCTDDLVKETVLVWHLKAFGGLRWSQVGGNDLGFWHVLIRGRFWIHPIRLLQQYVNARKRLIYSKSSTEHLHNSTIPAATIVLRLILKSITTASSHLLLE